MLSFISLFFWVVFGLAVLRYAVFFLSNRRAGDLTAIREGTGPLLFPVLRGVLTAVLADAVVLVSSLFLLLPEDEPPAPGLPVIMVHGLYHNRTAWRIMKRRLKKAGFTNLHTYQYNSFSRDFEPAVHGLLRKMDLVLAGRPEAKAILIGHSLGGLVSRCAAGNPRYRDRIAALITLGSPHKGSDLAWLGPNRMARDLLPGGHIARAVDRMPDPDCPRLGLYTLTDDYVFPLSMLRTGRPGWQEATCPPMAHVWMLYSRQVTKKVIHFLKEKVPAQAAQ
ncbi:MAG: alpha/beta fold hydrolase [Desulfovibrionaceae bacterium]|nr:alpha/beta fold hydrolase [Desulfovibrionaceae bacterium]